VPAAKTLGVAPVDIDGDGWLDPRRGHDTVPNLVFMNQHDGTFREIGAQSGAAFDSYGNTRGAMGIDTACYNNDGKLGIAIGNFANEMTALYVQQNSPTNFLRRSHHRGIGPDSRRFLKFGLFFFDYDLDGRLDLLTANGHIWSRKSAKIQASQTYAQPAQLFWNAGDQNGGCFVAVPPEKAGTDLFNPSSGAVRPLPTLTATATSTWCSRKLAVPPLLLRNRPEFAPPLDPTETCRHQKQPRRHRRLDQGECRRQDPVAAGNAAPQLSFPIRTALTIGWAMCPSRIAVKILWPSGNPAAGGKTFWRTS